MSSGCPKRGTTSFKRIPLALKDHSTWEAADKIQISDEDKDRYWRFVPAIRHYLDTGKLVESANLADCARQTLLDQVTRCVTLRSDGKPYGWAGLIANLRVSTYTRRAPLPVPNGDANKGGAGAFEKFLQEHPKLREALHDLIRKGGGSGSAIPSKPSFKGVAAAFIKLCYTVGHLTDNDYPLNFRDKGRQSVRRYAHKFLALDTKAIRAWYGETAAAQLSLQTGHHSFDFFSSVFDVVGADAHKFDCVGVLMLQGPVGPQIVPIKRIWFYPVVERKSTAVCGYTVSITTEISSAVVEEAVVACSTRWTPRAIRIKGLKYIDGAGFPVGAIDGLTEVRPCVVVFDNAAVHFSTRVTERMRRSLGCMVSFGGVGSWWNNGFVESLFGSLEALGIQALPFGTGTGPGDPMRKDAAAQAIKHKATWEELLDFIDVAVANYNATPKASLGHQSPLDVIRRHMETHQCLPRTAPPVSALSPALGITVENLRVAGRLKRGSAAGVYIQIDHVKYTNDNLKRRFDLVGQHCSVHIPEKDMRTVTAFAPDGQCLGTLAVLDKRWAQTPHSRDLRRTIMRLVNEGEIPLDVQCYVSTYMEHLAAKATDEARSRPKSVSPSATKLADTARQTGAPLPALPAPAPSTRPLDRGTRAALPGYIKPPAW